MKVYTNGIKKFAASLGLAMMAMTAASAVQAASFSIDDTVENQLTLNHDGNFEFGATSNGTVFSSYVGGSTQTAGESGTFIGTWYANTGQTGSGTVYIVEPGTNTVIATVAGTWSSTPGTPWDTATIDLAITSSACGANLGVLPAG